MVLAIRELKNKEVHIYNKKHLMIDNVSFVEGILENRFTRIKKEFKK